MRMYMIGAAAADGNAVCWFEELQGMAPDELGPPLLLDARLLEQSSLEVGDGLDDARAVLLSTVDTKVLHEISVRGHALDQLDLAGMLLHDKRQLSIDEVVTRYRSPLRDGQSCKLFQCYGWADPDSTHCKLFRHPAEVPLLVTQQHAPDASLAAGTDGFAPVLMYSPAVHKLLPHGHPGRVALEMLQHPGSEHSWLHCVLPLPPDHSFHGRTLLDVLQVLKYHVHMHVHVCINPCRDINVIQ